MAKRCNLTNIPDELYELIRADGEVRRETVAQAILRVLGDRYLSTPTPRRHHTDTIPTSSRRDVDTTPATGKLQKSDAEREGPDPRHREVRELIMNVHRETFNMECPWGAGEAGQLSQFLRTIPGVTVEQLGVMVRNRFRSEGIGPDRPMTYLANLTKYGAGPLDKFGKTKRAMKPAPVKYPVSRYSPEMQEIIRKANEE